MEFGKSKNLLAEIKKKQMANKTSTLIQKNNIDRS